MSIEKHKAFIDSLDGEKGLPEKFYRMLIPGVDVWQEGDEFLITHDQWMKNTWEKAFAFKVVMPEEIGRRAESRPKNAKPGLTRYGFSSTKTPAALMG